MKKVTFPISKEYTVINIEELKEILEKKYSKPMFIYERLSIVREEECSIETVISSIENIELIDFDVKYPNDLCQIVLKNGAKQTIQKSELDSIVIMPMETLKENRSLVYLKSIDYYKGELPQTIKVSFDKDVIVYLEGDVNSKENLNNLKKLLNYLPNKIIDLTEDVYTTKQYKTTETDAVIRLKFVNRTDNLAELDSFFYENRKIRIPAANIFKFSGYVFVKTENSNCLLLKESNRITN